MSYLQDVDGPRWSIHGLQGWAPVFGRSTNRGSKSRSGIWKDRWLALVRPCSPQAKPCSHALALQAMRRCLCGAKMSVHELSRLVRCRLRQASREGTALGQGPLARTRRHCQHFIRGLSVDLKRDLMGNNASIETNSTPISENLFRAKAYCS